MKKSFNTIMLTAGIVASVHAAPLGTAFTYQGRLNDGGRPASGNYDVVISLMDAPADGSPIGPIMALPNTAVSNGCFTIELDFGPNAFNGNGRWLQIGVRTNCSCLASYTQLSPRQPLNPAPHALFAVNAAQAATATSANSANSVAWTNVAGIPAALSDGVDNDTTYSAGPGLSLGGANQFSVTFGGTGGASTPARSDHHHFGANWSGTSSGYGLTVINNSAAGSALYSQQGTGSGQPATVNYKAAVWGESSHGDAVYGASGSAFGAGVYGRGTASSGANYGVYGQSDSTNGVGVFARGSGTAGTALKISNGAIRVAGAGVNTSTPAFIHVATAANLKTNFFNFKASVIDNPYCNNDPNAILILTVNDRLGFLQTTPPPAVFYDSGQSGGFATNRWVVTPAKPFVGDEIQEGAAFNVLVIKP